VHREEGEEERTTMSRVRRVPDVEHAGVAPVRVGRHRHVVQPMRDQTEGRLARACL